MGTRDHGICAFLVTVTILKDVPARRRHNPLKVPQKAYEELPRPLRLSPSPYFSVPSAAPALVLPPEPEPDHQQPSSFTADAQISHPLARCTTSFQTGHHLITHRHNPSWISIRRPEPCHCKVSTAGLQSKSRQNPSARFVSGKDGETPIEQYHIIAILRLRCSPLSMCVASYLPT